MQSYTTRTFTPGRRSKPRSCEKARGTSLTASTWSRRESLGRSERKELRAYLEGLGLHLLTWRYQPDYRSRSRRDSIEENRSCIPECLQENPSLRPQLPTLLVECYPRARRKAARQTRLPLATF